MKHTTIPRTTLISRGGFDLVKTFCIIDDFFDCFQGNSTGRKSNLSISELATISLLGNVYEIRCLKRLYELVKTSFSDDFPTLPDYNNFLLGMHRVSVYLLLFIQVMLKSRSSTNGDVCFIDGTQLPVCKIYRESSHKVMKQLATKSKSTTGWWYGLKLHLLCDRSGNLMRIKITTARVGERSVLKQWLQELENSIVIGDGGYVSTELDILAQRCSNILLTAKRKNMKTIATIWQNKCMNMRSRVETVFDVLKERFGLVTSLSRSVNGYLSHYVRCIFGYMLVG